MNNRPARRIYRRISRSLGAVILTLMLFAAAGQTQTRDFEDMQAKTPVAVLGALDKITTRLSRIEARQDEPIRFGTLEITMRHCRSNPPEETPESVVFLEIVDVGNDQQRKKVFSGWMFASSPAISPLEHPVYDIWLTSCKMVSGEASAARE